MSSNHDKPLVYLGLSGGVDSSVAAALLLAQGYRVHAVFMQNWDDQDEGCTARQDYRDAEAVAKKLDLSFEAVNFSDEYWDRVFEHFLAEYSVGRTPNPDILCNREVKFKAFLDYALEKGADHIATGHYARVQHTANGSSLLRGVDQNKDQTYFLNALNQTQLKHSLFPVGELTKDEVRAHAKALALHVHDKKDSTGICFIGERSFNEFLAKYLPAQPGDIVTDDGEIIGRHNGLMYHTYGQRKGLGIGGSKHRSEEAWFAIDKDLKNNQLIVGQGHNHPRLLKKQLIAEQLSWCADKQPLSPFNCSAKVRYRQADVNCQVSVANGLATVIFEQAVRAITPGQSIVFYDNEICLGGGIIQ